MLQPATATGHWPWLLLLLLLATRAALAPAPAPAVATAAVAASGMPACLPVCLAACLIACLRASLSDWLLDWLADCLAEPRWRITAKPAQKPHGGFLYKRVAQKTRELSSEARIPCLRMRLSYANETKKQGKARLSKPTKTQQLVAQGVPKTRKMLESLRKRAHLPRGAHVLPTRVLKHVWRTTVKPEREAREVKLLFDASELERKT